jgi:penicillin amidase
MRATQLLVVLAFALVGACTSPAHRAARGANVPDTLVHAPGLSAPVRIVTDADGIPHVRAETLDDLYFAWGYVTARERLWQIAHNRAAARGERWRWMGNDVLRADGAAQLMQFADYAGRLWAREKSDPRVGPPLERYTDGINAWIERCERGEAAWPVEFRTLGATPERWRPEDSALLLWSLGVLLDLDLSELGERDEIAKLGTAGVAERRRYESDVTYTTIPDSAARRMWGDPAAREARAVAATRPGHAERRMLAGRAAPDARLAAALEPLRAAFGRREEGAHASNVFAVGSGRSASGAPLLANDMHLGLSVPAAVMAIHLTVPGIVDAAGAFPPGLPAIVSGRNRDCAWGITALSADMLDVYADSISADGRTVKGPDGAWTPVQIEPFAMRYRVLGVPLPPFGQSRRYGPHGPILIWDRKARIAWGLRWSALTDSLSLAELIGLERSGSAAELDARWRTLVTPGINVVMADRTGDVRYRATGAVPLRTHDPGRGPAAGDGMDEWLGTVTPEAMPAWRAPAAGYVVNSNNLPIGDAYPVPLPRFDWSMDRAIRIDQKLSSLIRADRGAMLAIQNDTYSLRAERFLPLMLAAADSVADRHSPGMRAALDTLRAWDLESRRDRMAPAVFWAWYGTLERRAGLGGLPGRLHASLRGDAPASLAHPESGAPERAAHAATAALESALVALETRLGPDRAAWHYGNVHLAAFDHPLDDRPGIAALMPDSVAIDGDGGTVSVGRSFLPRHVRVSHAPVFRHVVDLADPDRSWLIVAPGNSGDLEGPHGRDLTQRWADHDPVELRMRWDEIERAEGARSTRLVP